MKSDELNWTGAQILADFKALLLPALAGVVLALMLAVLLMAVLAMTSPA